MLSVALLAIVIRSLLSFVPGAPNSALGTALERATEPLLGPVRRVVKPVQVGTAALDLAPLVVGIGIMVLRGVIC